ncbi:Zinc finger protein 621 [Frankliniella fusca]|uniref:Zinc finger protein 621 n=1 Tax=Frankliniella fusca TaxID=407009 RepID=A0AAE1I0D7_9NEOP|nr:Zinc finger protein 621 [Frankliniella fusca]
MDPSGETFFKCKESKKGTQKGYHCKARAKNYLGGPLERTMGHHNHPVNPHFTNFMQLRRELIHLLLQQSYRQSRLQIYKDFVNKIENRQVAGLFSTKSIFAAVDYLRKDKKPKPPTTFEEVDEILNNPDFAHLGLSLDDGAQLYQGKVGPDGEESLVFASPRALKMVLESDVVASDATFKITPRLLGALQVMIFAVFAFGHVS